MPKSRQDIQFKVVSILVGGDVGAPVSAEDADTINGYIDSEVDELNADGTIYIADPDDLDDSLFITFCKLVANAARSEFQAGFGFKLTDKRVLHQFASETSARRLSDNRSVFLRPIEAKHISID